MKKKRADHYELSILSAYDSFSGKDHDRFRLVFLNDVSVSDKRVAKAMLLALAGIFPEADPLCYKDIYGDNANIIPEEIPELLAYMKDVMPSEEMQKSLKPNVLDTVVDVERYLPRKSGH